MNLQRQIFQVRHWVVKQGQIFWVAAALLLGSSGFYVFAVLPLHDQVLQARLSLETRSKSAQEVRLDAPTATQRLSQWLGSLPSQDQLLEPLSLIVRAAESAGVDLQKGEYKLQRENASALQRFQLTFPVQSTYPAIRVWLAEVVKELPQLALQSMSIQRQSTLTDQVDARIVFIFYAKTQP